MASVLVVDDDPAIARLIRHALVKARIDVIAAFGVTDAIELIQAGGLDAIVLDLVLGHRSGFDVLLTMRRDRITTPVIVTSAKLPDYARMLLDPSQVLTIVKKPFDVEMMATVISGLCGVTDEADEQSSQSRAVSPE